MSPEQWFVSPRAGLVADQQVQRREELLVAKFPVVADPLALAVTAGESPTAAIARVTWLSGGELARELGAALGRARSGVPLVDALQAVADHPSLDPLARFIDGLLVAIERGTPLAEVLRRPDRGRPRGRQAPAARGRRSEGDRHDGRHLASPRCTRVRGAPARVVERARIMLLAGEGVQVSRSPGWWLCRADGGDLVAALCRAGPGGAGRLAAARQTISADGAAGSGVLPTVNTSL